MSDGLGWAWAPDGTQPVRDEVDALRAVPADPVTPDASGRRPGDVVIPAVPLGGDPRLAADAITRWMDEDRARATPPLPHAPASEGAVRSVPRSEGAPRPPAPARHPGKPPSEGAVRSAQWSEGAPRSKPAPPAPAPRPGGGLLAWMPAVALAVMVIAILLVVLSGGG